MNSKIYFLKNFLQKVLEIHKFQEIYHSCGKKFSGKFTNNCNLENCFESNFLHFD